MTQKEKNFKILFNEARIAGLEAVKNFKPEPMVVNDGPKQYFVPGGVCGFSEVIINPGNCPAANFAKKNLGAKKHYYGGIYLWCFEFGQSMETKQVYTAAYAKVLRAAGIDARSQSRMD